MDRQSKSVINWLRNGTDSARVIDNRCSLRLSTGLARARLYKANNGKPRLARARRVGNRVVFAKGIPLWYALSH